MTKRLGDIRLPYRHFERKREIFVIRGLRLTLSPHVPRTSPHFSSVFHTDCALSAPTGHLPLEGKADDTRETCHRKPSGIAPFEPFEPVDPEPRSLKAGIRDE